MFLDTVTFEPSAGFRAQDLNTIRTNKSVKKLPRLSNRCYVILCSSEVSVFGKDSFLPPRNIRQHLYKLTPLSPLQTTATVSFYSCQFSIDYIAGTHFDEKYFPNVMLYLECYLRFILQVSNVHVGKMDIVWRSRFGERGRIQTGQLKATSVTPHSMASSRASWRKMYCCCSYGKYKVVKIKVV